MHKILFTLLLVLLAVLLLVGATAWAGPKRVLAKAVVAPDFMPVEEQPGQPVVPFTPYKIDALTQVIGTSDYDYGWNSGGPTRIVYYKGVDDTARVYMIFIRRTSASQATREITYVSYNGKTFLTPIPVVLATTNATYFSGIDVWRRGPADGFAAVAAGWAAGNRSYYALESSPGGGQFTAGLASIHRDTGTLSLDSNGTAVFWDTKGRTDYRFQKSTDFGVTWVEVDTGVIATTNITPANHTQNTLDVPVVKGPTGDLFLGATLGGAGNAGPALDNVSPDSADWWGYFRSTNQGRTWSWTRISYDGQQLVPGYFNLIENFDQHDLAVDGNNKVHCVANGYSVRTKPDSSRETIDVYYWNSTVGVKSLVSFNKELDIIDSLVIPLRAANALGCSYPTIAVSNNGQIVVCVWSQPKFTATAIDTGATGVMCYDLYYNASFNGGATWKGATRLTNTTGKAETFPTLANDLEAIAGGGVRARVLYLDDSRPGQSLNTIPKATPAGQENWVYQEFEITPTGVNERGGEVPQSFTLEQNYPNPFNPSTKIVYSLPSRSDVKLTVYNVLGQEVARLVNEVKEAGNHEVEFSAAKMSSGVYFYTINAGQYVNTKKMVLMK